MKRRKTSCNEEGVVLLTGLLGLSAAMFFACDDGDESHSMVGADTASPTGSGTGGTQSAGGEGATPAATTSCESTEATAENTAAVVAAASAFIEALTPEQQTAAKYDNTLANAQSWSNLPTTFMQRNGVKLDDMSAEAQSAAVALVEVAAGADGATLFSEIRAADEFLVTDGHASSSDYGDGLYYFSIHGTPSTSAAWMLQIGGHHLAYNFTYAGKCTSATPLFDGVEPTVWVDANGKAHIPIEAQRRAMDMLMSSVASLPGAMLSGTFSDLVNGPAGDGPGGDASGDTKYPDGLMYPTGTTGRGVLVSTLSAEQRALVKTAIEAWVGNVAAPVASALLATYESDDALAQTYVGYSGAPDLSTQGSYARIDGPRVWIEITAQGGIVYRDKVHYHTIWRDKVADYGAEYVSR